MADDMQVLLRTVDELGGASAGLVAWELFMSGQRVATVWWEAQRLGLIEASHRDGGELMYAVSALERRVLDSESLARPDRSVLPMVRQIADA